MFQKATSSLLAVLLLGTLIVGRCAACPLVAPQTQSRGCCHHGSCQMPTPQKQPAGKVCPVQALAQERYHQIDFGAAHLVPALSVAAVLPALPPTPDMAAAQDTPAEHAPPDLYLLNSTLLV